MTLLTVLGRILPRCRLKSGELLPMSGVYVQDFHCSQQYYMYSTDMLYLCIHVAAALPLV